MDVQALLGSLDVQAQHNSMDVQALLGSLDVQALLGSMDVQAQHTAWMSRLCLGAWMSRRRMSRPSTIAWMSRSTDLVRALICRQLGMCRQSMLMGKLALGWGVNSSYVMTASQHPEVETIQPAIIKGSVDNNTLRKAAYASHGCNDAYVYSKIYPR